jgi:hypothetical protein
MIEEDAENANVEQGEINENDSIDEMTDNAANATAAEESVSIPENQEVRAEVKAAEKADATEKERRSKKRNERPPASEEDKPVRILRG